MVAGEERSLEFTVTDASGAVLQVQPYMGMIGHAIIASRDASVFAHLHPSGSISMAALQKFTAERADAAHASHEESMAGRVSIPFAVPRPGPYRVWAQFKRDGRVLTASFDAVVAERRYAADVDSSDCGPTEFDRYAVGRLMTQGGEHSRLAWHSADAPILIRFASL